MREQMPLARMFQYRYQFLHYLIYTYGAITTLDIIAALWFGRFANPRARMRNWGRTPPEVVLMIGGVSMYQFFRHTELPNYVTGAPGVRFMDLLASPIFTTGQIAVMYKLAMDLMRRSALQGRYAEWDQDEDEEYDQQIRLPTDYYVMAGLDGTVYDRPDSP